MKDFIKGKFNGKGQIIINDGSEASYKRPSISLFSLGESQDIKKDNYINLLDGIKSKKDFMETKSIFLGRQTKDNENIYSSLDELGNIFVVGEEEERKEFLNSFLANISLNYLPSELRFALIGPSSEKYSQFRRHPLMFFKNPISSLMPSVELLDDVLIEVNERYKYFNRLSVSSYDEYMKMPEVINKELPSIPRLVLIVEEYVDFWVEDGINAIPRHLVKLCKNSNNAGVTIILMTSDILKETFPSNLKRLFKTIISYKLLNKEKNKILFSKDIKENLIKKGNMLLKFRDDNNLKGLYSSYITETNLKEINSYLKSFSTDDFHSDIENYIYKVSCIPINPYEILDLYYIIERFSCRELYPKAFMIDNRNIPVKDLMTKTIKILFAVEDPTIDIVMKILRISRGKTCAILRMLEKQKCVKLVKNEPKEILISYETFKKNVLNFENYDTILVSATEINYSDKNYEVETETVYDDVDYKYGYDIDKKFRKNVHRVLAKAFQTEIPRRKEIEQELSLNMVDGITIFSYLEDKLLIIKGLNSDRFVLRMTKEDYNKKYGIEFGIIE